MTAQIGAPAPDFTLVDQDRNRVSLSDFKGHKTMVVFIPNPFTGVCDGEVCALRDDLPAFSDLDAAVVVITTSPRPANARWAQENGFDFDVLSDFWPHGEVTNAYGAFDERYGAARRVTYVLDAEGVVTGVIDSPELGTARAHDLYAEALQPA